MIVRVTGLLEGVEGNRALVVPEGSGLAYEVMVPTYLATRLEGQVGQRLTLHTMEYHESRDQGGSFVPRILGFGSPQERAFFELFTTVKGLGNRRGLRALAAEPGVIAGWIARRDARSLQGLPEIGKRLAETVIAELNGKVEPYASGATGGQVEPKFTRAGDTAFVGLTPAGAEAARALVALGETPADAERMVARVLERAAGPKTASEIVSAAYASR